MKVLIDATAITKNKAGVGVYAKNLIQELQGLNRPLHLYILAQDDDPDLDHSDCPNVTMIWIPAKLFRKLPARFLLEQFGIPLLLLKFRIHVIHSLNYSFPLVRFAAKQVVTLHDMTFFNMPEVHVPFKVLYFRLFIRAAVRFADALVFVSHSAQRDCIARLGSPKGSISVIHHGASQAFRSDLSADSIKRAREKYGLPTDFILHVGTIEPRKNLNRLVEVFALLSQCHPELVLVLVGMRGWMCNSLFARIRHLNLESRVIFTGFIAEADKPLLMSAARVFVYPSLYEGFGLPVLEALACGVPTVASNRSSLPEVAGQAALLVDPTNEPEILRAIEELLSNSTLRQQLREEAIQQAAKFTWCEAAILTANLYKDTLADGHEYPKGAYPLRFG
ncbi:glycosyltransferase family 1 protein [Granulicella sp. dw_53]|uniref:glycosyltransferase family 4 protein n=1 Tax=Granulicella sp. dw_53 TaxID=2719792 RepID=UPI001BD5C1E3|nr:glycosyltransferase family 1 protein [Granulicella sp. dw_53]